MSTLPGSGNNSMIASACPFCKTMLSDGLADQGLESVRQIDIAELLWQAVQVEEMPVGAVSSAQPAT
jgi:Fe-S oxidoreductase